MNKILSFLKLIFYVSVIFLIILSLFPGSLIGLWVYGDLGKQPNLINNPYGTTINHFIYYFYVSLLGFVLYLKSNKIQKIFYVLIFLSLLLEILQYFVPNRAFQFEDMSANFLGVLVAYSAVKIYLFFNKI